MNEVDYTPNSHKYKQEQAEKEKPKAEKVVTGAVAVKKKSGVTKFADAFISKDIHGLGSYIVDDFVIPTAKKLVSDILKYAVDTIFYGKSGAGKTTRTSGDYVSYNKISSRVDDRRDEPRKSVFDYDTFNYQTRGDAEAVLDNMRRHIDQFGYVSVNDLYDMVDKTAPFTATRYGWTDLRGSEVTRGRDGYNIELPRAELLR